MEARVVRWPDWEKVRFSGKQAAVFFDEARKLIISAGRGFGKDYICLQRALRLGFGLYAKRKADKRWNRDGPVVNIGIVAPSSGNFEGIWEKLPSMVPVIPGLARGGQPNTHFRNKDYRVELFGKGEIQIQCISLVQKNNIRSKGFDILIVTEAAFLDESVYLSILKPLVQRPGYAGYIMLNSTPLNNWYDKACGQARKFRDEKIREGAYSGFSFHQAATTDNPMVESWLIDEMEHDRETNPWRYRQEYLGELFVDVPEDDDETSDDERAFNIEALDGVWLTDKVEWTGPFSVGIDLAWGGVDDLCVAVVDMATMTLCHLEAHPSMDQQRIRRLIKRLHEDWENPVITYDATGRLGAKVEGALKGYRIRPKKTVTDEQKREMVAKFERHVILDQTVRLPHPDTYPFPTTEFRQHMQRLRREMKSYRARPMVNANGRRWVHYGKSARGTDDMIDAVMHAVYWIPVRIKAAAASGAGEMRPLDRALGI